MRGSVLLEKTTRASGPLLLVLLAAALWLPAAAFSSEPEIVSLTSSAVPNENGWSNAPSITFSWDVDDASSIVGYSYAYGGTWLDDPPPLSPDETVDTTETSAVCTAEPGLFSLSWFSVRACDSAGNWGAPTSITFRNDPWAPSASTLEVLPGYSAKTSQLSAIVSASATCRTNWRGEGYGNSSNMWYWQWSYDGGPWVADTGAGQAVPVSSDHSNDGEHHIALCRGWDLAGNVSPTYRFDISIDTSPPTLALSGADDAWHPLSAFVVSASDGSGLANLGVSCVETGWSHAEPYPPLGSITLPREYFPDGIYTLDCSAADLAVSPNIASISSAQIKVDSSAPFTRSVGLQESSANWQSAGERVVLTAVDPFSGVGSTAYVLDGVTHAYTAPFTVNGEGSHTVSYFSTDNVGNVESVSTGYLNIDSHAPSTSTSTDAVSATVDGTATFAFTVSDPLPSCGAATATIQVFTARKVLATLSLGIVAANRSLSYDWPVAIKKGAYSYRVLATDIAGNAATVVGTGKLTITKN